MGHFQLTLKLGKEQTTLSLSADSLTHPSYMDGSTFYSVRNKPSNYRGTHAMT